MGKGRPLNVTIRMISGIISIETKMDLYEASKILGGINFREIAVKTGFSPSYITMVAKGHRQNSSITIELNKAVTERIMLLRKHSFILENYK